MKLKTRQWLIVPLMLLLVLLYATVTMASEPRIVAAFFVKGKVGLKWRQISGVSEYFIYRQAGDDESILIATLEDDHYFDAEVTPGTTYDYRIAIAGEGGEQVFSATKSVTIPGMVGDFKPPTWVGLRIHQNKIHLNWDPVSGAMAYNVWRANTSGGDYEIIGNTQGSRYADRDNLENGSTYYYILTAMNSDFDETEYSEEQSIKFGTSLAEQEAELAEMSNIHLVDAKLTELFRIKQGGSGSDLNQPADVFVNSKGNIYLSDMLNARVTCYDSRGKHLFSFGEKMPEGDPADHPGMFILPIALFIDGKDQIYVADNERNDIQVFDAGGNFLRRIQVAIGEGKTPLRAGGISVLPDGRIIIADTGNHRLLILDGDGKILSQIGKRGADEGELNFPGELVITENGTVCVVDIMNNRVQEFDLDGKFIRMFGGIGKSAGTFARPTGIAQDGKGRLWISDAMSHMIQGFTVEGEVKSVVGSNQDEWEFTSPRGMFFSQGRFYVVNRLSNDVVVYEVGDF